MSFFIVNSYFNKIGNFLSLFIVAKLYEHNNNAYEALLKNLAVWFTDKV